MAKITPNSGVEFIELDNWTQYKGALAFIDWQSSLPQYQKHDRNSDCPGGGLGSCTCGGGYQMIVDWQVGDDPNDTVRDYVSLRLGKQQGGTVSRFRKLLNAVSMREPTAEIDEFDDSTLEFSWLEGGTRQSNKLSIGMEVIFVGQNVARDENDAQKGTRFAIKEYEMVRKPKAANDGQARRRPKPAGVAAETEAEPASQGDDSDLPF